MRFLGLVLMIGLYLPGLAFSFEGPVRTSVSFDMIRGLPKEARCLEQVKSVFSNLIVEDTPWKRIMARLEHGETDLTPCVFQTENRKSFLNFYGPIAHMPIMMVIPDDQYYTLADIERLQGVFLLGTSLIKDYIKPGMSYREVRTIEVILNVLKTRRADYAIMPHNFMTGRDITGLKMRVIKENPLYVGISKKSPLKDQILKALQENLDIRQGRNIAQQ